MLKFVLALIFVACFGLVVPSIVVDSQPLKACNVDQIFNLGDSISDTGNLIIESPTSVFSRLPYGQDSAYIQQDSIYYFLNTTGRCSNGLLMIDYIAMAAGLPLLPPYENMFLDEAYVTSDAGSNFAVAGSTALSPQVLSSKYNVSSPVTRSSLNVQLDWLSEHFKNIYDNQTERDQKLQRAIVMLGEIGGNDYNYAMFQGKPMHELLAMVPDVVDTIINGVRRAISLGATRVVVPGNFPIGCLPIYKTAFETNISRAYDRHQCLRQLNNFAEYHNGELQQGIQKLIEQEKPNALVVYGDYYNAYKHLLRYSNHHGIDTQRACCGTGGRYNFNLTRLCGAEGVPVCADPDRSMSWDGIHLTQEGYKIMAAWLVRDLFGKLHCHL